jgi:hypothetical protein
MLLCFACQVEVLYEQLAASQEQLRAAKATVEEQQRQLADSKLALTGALEGDAMQGMLDLCFPDAAGVPW